MTFQLPTSEEKADFVLRQFDRIARRYDLTNDAISLGMHRLWKNAAIESLAVTRAGKYLDVCTGTGDLALNLAHRLGEDGQVTGIDFSAGMLAVAANRTAAAGSRGSVKARVDWVEGDAENLPFADDSFDGAIISFGLRNLTNLQQGINEMSRVVKRGGKVVNLDLGHPRTPVFSPLFLFYFRNIVPVVGQLLQNDRSAYTYLPESLSSYPQPEKISEMFQRAGLAEVIFRPLACGSVALHVGTVS